MQIRSATIDDARAISDLVTAVARTHVAPTLSEDGLSHLLTGMTPENQAERLRDGYQFFVAEDTGSIIGVVAIRPPTHLYYLFVHPDRQRNGIGRQLWKLALDWAIETSSLDTFTLNSSLNAIGAYERLGFSIAGPMQERHGVRYQPMQLKMVTEPSDAPKSPVDREFESSFFCGD